MVRTGSNCSPTLQDVVPGTRQACRSMKRWEYMQRKLQMTLVLHHLKGIPAVRFVIRVLIPDEVYVRYVKGDTAFVPCMACICWDVSRPESIDVQDRSRWKEEPEGLFAC